MVSSPRITKLTNGLLTYNGSLMPADIWVDSQTGKILNSQSAFYGEHLVPDQTVDLNGKIVSPGFIDVQLNGAYGFNFSVPSPNYQAAFQKTNRDLVKGGVTSYLPTVTSQKPEVYHAVLPYLGPSGRSRHTADGAESLGAHVEGPFISPAKNGIHTPDVLRKADSVADLEECYGVENFKSIRKITAAPELGNMTSIIPQLTSKGIVCSIGHSDGTYEQAQQAIDAGATMVTHMFNAMRPFGHRDPGIFGLLGQSESPPTSPRSSKRSSPASTPRSSVSIHQPNQYTKKSFRPFFGLISDGIHLHPSSVKIAYSAHPEGTILVTDAMELAGCEDGTYNWTNGERIIKNGPVLTLEANGRIAGSAVTLIECINNFRRFTGCSIPEALACVTSHPAKMLGQEGEKGGLEGGMDADLVVFDEDVDGELCVEQVWKFGGKIYG